MEKAVSLLVREQLRDPHLAPALLFARGHGPYFEAAHSLGCPVISLNLPHSRALPRIREIARAMRGFDVHHFHSAEPLLMLASTRCPGIRRIYTHRGGYIDYSLGKRLRHELVGFLLRHYFHGYSGNTAHGARCGARIFHLSPEHLHVTYNGLDFDSIAPQRSRAAVRAELGFDETHLVVGTCANLKPWKRIERLIEALVALALPDQRLLIVGDGIDKGRLEALVREFGVQSQVTFAGLVTKTWEYLQAMDTFCLPSMGLESFGNAAVEAMAMGVPTIVFADGGGLVEHIEEGNTGFVVSTQKELEVTLRKLLSDRDLRDRVGARGSAAVRNRYSTERSACGYRELYAEALGRSKPVVKVASS